MRTKTGRQGGFTLVELAIVLVVVGLLLGGVMKGTDMIRKAKAERFVADLRGLASAILDYQKSHGRLPGDCNNDGVIGTTAPATVQTVGVPYSLSADPYASYCAAANTAEAGIDIPWNDMRIGGTFDKTRVNQQLAKHQNNDYFVISNITGGGQTANAILVYGIPQWLAESIDLQIDGLNAAGGATANGTAGRVRLCATGPATATTNACPGVAFPVAAGTDVDQSVMIAYQFDTRVLP